MDLLNELLIYYQNVRGLNTKLSILSSSLDVSDYDILIFTETWLKDSTRDSEIFDLDIFNIYRDDRLNGVRGAVLIAIKSRFISSYVNITNVLFSSPYINVVACKLFCESNPIIIVTIYISPNIPLNEFDNFFESLSNVCASWSCNYIILSVILIFQI